MTKQLTEAEVKAHVKELRNFYVNLTLYGSVNLGLILIWAISGGGNFWPIWVIVGWGIGMLLKAISLDMIPALADLFPFFDKAWEEQQIKRMLNGKQNSPSLKTSMQKTVTTPLKTAASATKLTVKAPTVKASSALKQSSSTKVKKEKASKPKAAKKITSTPKK